MSPGPYDIESLIASYLSGEASREEMALVENWKNESDSNRRYFEQLKLIFEQATDTTGSEGFDVDRAWEKFRTRISDPHNGNTIPLKSRFPDYRLFMRIAAGIVVFLGVGFLAYNFFRNDAVGHLEVLAGKTTASDTLPEGSEVFLNRQTRIEYRFNERKDAHTAKLVGEAYFNINHNEDKTFIVQAEETFIKDIGTAFNVKAYPEAATIEVVVEEGEVMFYTEGNPGIYLKANGKGIYDKKTRTFVVAEPEPNVTAYKTKFFSFSNHSLETVVKTLNDVYPEKIEIGENLRECHLTVSFNDESIGEIANIIAETLGLTVSESGNIITLKGPGCAGSEP